MNAVFERDFTAFSVSKRFLWLRFAFAASMGAMLLFTILPAYMSRDFSDIGLRVFSMSVTIGFALVVITVPGSFSTVLVHARAGATLPVLLTTPLSALQIAAGAFAARAALFLVLIVATWPPLALSLLYGGVQGWQLFAATASILAAALLVATPAYLASAFARRTSAAVVAAYIAAITLLGGLQVLAVGPWHVGGWLLADHGSAFSPIEAAGLSTRGAQRAIAAPVEPYVLLAWSAAAAACAILLVAWRLAREGRGTADEARVAMVAGRRCRALRHENPVLDRELRGAGFLRRGATGRGLLFVLLATEGVFCALAGASGEWTSLPLHFGVLAMQTFLIVLAVTAAGATCLAAEREGRTLDLVRVTPLTPREIVVGKLSGLLRGFAPCLVVPFGHLVFAASIGVFSWLAPVAMAFSGTLALTTWAVCALSQSLDQPNPNRAVIRTMGAFGIVAVLVAVNVGLPVYGVFHQYDTWVRAGGAFGANPVALTLLPVAGLRLQGSDAQNTVTAALGAQDQVFAIVACAIWVAVHVGFTFAIYRKLFHTYRSRVDG